MHLSRYVQKPIRSVKFDARKQFVVICYAKTIKEFYTLIFKKFKTINNISNCQLWLSFFYLLSDYLSFKRLNAMKYNNGNGVLNG